MSTRKPRIGFPPACAREVLDHDTDVFNFVVDEVKMVSRDDNLYVPTDHRLD